MLNLPTTKEEIEGLISNQVQEDIHLEYKRSDAIDNSQKSEIAKDVSAFANSDGGVIIYGVVEENHLPVRIDSGVNHQKFHREWFDQVVRSNISPRIEDVRIASIPLSSDRSLYAIWIPKSFRGPHQAPSKHYYKRYNFTSTPMEDYEINDVRQRRRNLPSLVNVEAQSRRQGLIYLIVSNKGDASAENVTFQFPDNFTWLNTLPTPNLFMSGIKSLAPGKEFHFLYRRFSDIANEGSHLPGCFEVAATYTHPATGQRITEVFNIDVLDYFNSEIYHSELYDTSERIRKELKDLVGQVEKFNRNLEQLTSLVSATGLNLSHSTLNNLRRLFNGEQDLEKINPTECDPSVFREVLGTSARMALQLRDFFLDPRLDKKLEEVAGMTDELIHKLKKHFLIDQ